MVLGLVHRLCKNYSAFILTLYTLGVISIKFLLVISMLYKTEWSRELRTGSDDEFA